MQLQEMAKTNILENTLRVQALLLFVLLLLLLNIIWILDYYLDLDFGQFCLKYNGMIIKVKC